MLRNVFSIFRVVVVNEKFHNIGFNNLQATIRLPENELHAYEIWFAFDSWKFVSMFVSIIAAVF